MPKNGQLPAGALSPIPGGHLAKGGPARSWLAMRYYIGRKTGVWIHPTGPQSSYRDLATQQQFYADYLRGDGPLAAKPGTSNHGLGLAVDLPTAKMQAQVRKYGHLFGWGIQGGKLASDAPSESWHATWRSYPPVAVAWYARWRAAKLAQRQITDEGLKLIKRFEGFRSAPYRDPVGVWTVGYGETKGVTSRTKPVTEAQAARALRKRISADYMPPVVSTAKRIGLTLKPLERDALTSLVYNLGPGVLDAGRTMGDALRSKDRKRIADAFLVYNKAGGKVFQGLVNRRAAERALFLKGTP